MIAEIYKALWQVIGGRPWTYIMRDIWHKYEGLCIITLVALDTLLGHWLWPLAFWLLFIFALGYIAGHLFWGTKYIPNQTGKD